MRSLLLTGHEQIKQAAGGVCDTRDTRDTRDTLNLFGLSASHPVDGSEQGESGTCGDLAAVVTTRD